MKFRWLLIYGEDDCAVVRRESYGQTLKYVLQVRLGDAYPWETIPVVEGPNDDRSAPTVSGVQS